MSKAAFAGIDMGSSRIKAVILDEDKNIVGCSVKKSGFDFASTAIEAINEALNNAGLVKENIVKTGSTGYGRNNVGFADFEKTEISCHAKGCYHYFGFAISIIDIGGQDNKVIKLDEKGKLLGFKMNRKCAAGTGAFLEETAMRLNVAVEDLNNLADKAIEMVKIGSFCTVFSATEVLENIRKGKKIEDLTKGLFFSVIQRALEMDSITGDLVMTGGVVAHNPIIVKMTSEITGKNVLVADYPQYTGAIGAALYAME
jgi:(R)-2-hydroxyacyl-CoA dehydratese activating ATPase